MKKVLFALVAVFGLVAPAQADIILSTSSTNAAAGNTLNLSQGESGSLFVFVSTNNGQVLDGLSLDIRGNNSNLTADAYNIQQTNGDGSNRWSGVTLSGTAVANANFDVGGSSVFHLVNDANALAIPAFGFPGLTTSGQSDFVLYSELQFTANAEGVTELVLAPGDQNISAIGEGNIGDTISFSGATVNVTSAVPEPGSLLALSVLGAGLALVRRRK